MTNKYILILASKSPRRSNYLSGINIPFKIISSSLPEKSIEKDPIEYCKDISYQKGIAVWNKLSLRDQKESIILSADTIISLDNKIIGKPKNLKDAKSILRSLSGVTHKVITAVSVKSLSISHTIYCETSVTFSKIDKETINDYLKNENTLDMAGAYAIQGMAEYFIIEINGSYSNVVGFPLEQVVSLLCTITGQQNLAQLIKVL